MDARRKKDAKEIFNSAPGFFGQILDHEAPIIVCDCMAYIRNKGLYDVGVFRVSGSQDVVNILKSKYDAEYASKDAKEGSMTSILNSHEPPPSVNDIASLLKAFFKELSTPLIPVQTTEELVRIIRSGEDEEAQTNAMSKVVKAMPSPNRECLGFLVSFLREICTFKKFNQMSAENLATCFVLSVMGGSDAFDQLYLLGNGAIVIKKLITKSINLYMPSVQNVKKNTKYKDASAPSKPAAANPQTSPQHERSASNVDEVEGMLSGNRPPKPRRDKKPRANRYEGVTEPNRVRDNTKNNRTDTVDDATNILSSPSHGANKKKRNKQKNAGGSGGVKPRGQRNLPPAEAFPAYNQMSQSSGTKLRPTNNASGDDFPELAPPNTFLRPHRDAAPRPTYNDPQQPDF